MVHKLQNEQEVKDFMRDNFRIFCNQFGEPTLRGRKTPNNGWRVKCEEVDVNWKDQTGVAHTDWPPRLRLKAINKKRGLSINVDLTYEPPYYRPTNSHNGTIATCRKARWIIKRRTIGSGYETLFDCQDTKGLPTNLLHKIEEVVFVHQKCVPLPLHFSEDLFIPSLYSATDRVYYVANTCQIGRLKVDGVVSFSLKNKKVDLNPPQKPDQDAFFLCDGESHQGATFNMITDGKVYYPITRITSSTRTVRIRSDFGKASMGTELNAIDKLLVQKAIEEYVERTFGASQQKD